MVSDEGEQIDAIAEKRGWFRGDKQSPFYNSIRLYMEGSLSLELTIDAITTPIEKVYSVPENKRFNKRNDSPSVEGFLWDLWYSVLHIAKRTPWRDTTAQTKLVDLVRALKAHPDPPVPEHKRDWVASQTKLWSVLKMIGWAASESWNDSPGYGAGYTVPEIHAWTNVNAFVAHLTQSEISDFFIYSIYAMRDALEDDQKDIANGQHRKASAITQLDTRVPAAAVWAITLGRMLWEKNENLKPTDPRHGNPGKGGILWEKEGGEAEFSTSRYAFWARRFRDVSSDDRLAAETREIATEAYITMEGIVKATQ